MEAPMNSTNVRIEAEGMRSLFLALAAWAALVAMGTADGVFARLDPAVDGSLAAFGALFALAACCLDRSVALQLAAGGLPVLGSGAGAFLTFFAAPVAIAAHVAVARRLAARLRSRAARSPAGRPASI